MELLYVYAGGGVAGWGVALLHGGDFAGTLGLAAGVLLLYRGWKAL